MSSDKEHILIPKMKADLAEGRIDRREFLRYATFVGMSSTAAYAFANKVTGGGLVAPAAAQGAMPKGGTFKISMRVQDLKSPHTYSWIEGANATRQVLEYLTDTGFDNVTRPKLLQKWEATEDLKTWTLHLRRDVKWHNGRQFTADDVVWNLNRVLDSKTGSSVLGLMKGYMISEFDGGEKDAKGNPKKSTRLWDAQAIQKKDDFTVVINAKEPQLAVPEHLFHYPLLMCDPAENGEFKVGSNGTGAFRLESLDVGRRAVLRAKPGYWGGGPNLDAIEIIDTGDEAAAKLAAFASKQVDGFNLGDVTILEAMQKMPNAQLHQVMGSYTAVARFHINNKPFDDKRVRQAMRLAVDQAEILQISLKGLGGVAEHHHVAPVLPDYAQMPMIKRDVAKAKALLAEAGYPNGIDVELAYRPQPDWEKTAVEAMAEQWKAAGIRVKLNLMPSTQYWDVWTKVPFGFTTWAHRPLGVMLLGLAYRSGVAWNESNFSNKTFDDLLTKAEGTYDIAKRKEIMGQLQKIMQDEGPIVQPVWRSLFTFMDKRVQGFRMHPSGYLDGYKLALAPA
ncbi:MAG: ABC transporter substrate-binding protein [Alphaproteobacteria bacterium]|nr:ABC transporter substrate-binding protein [Alphaproteobacteria bacterium]